MAIITNPHYTEVTTNTTLTAVEGKEYNVKNTGASTITITYGSDTLLLSVGFTCILYYVESTWALLGGFNTEGVFLASGGIELTAGRVAFQELKSTNRTGSGWYTIAEGAPNTFERYSADFTVSVTGTNRNGTMRIKTNFSNSSGAKTTDRNSITIEDFSSFSAATSPFPFSGVLAARIAKSDTSNSAGAKLQAYIDIDGSADVTIQMSNNYGEVGTGNGWELKTATTTDFDKTPDGSTASFIIAGEELDCKVGSTGAVHVPWVGVNVISADTIRLMLDWNKCAYGAATQIDYVGTSTNTFGIAVASTLVSAIDASTGTFGGLIIKEDRVYCTFTLAGAFTGLTTFSGGNFISESSGAKFILS